MHKHIDRHADEGYVPIYSATGEQEQKQRPKGGDDAADASSDAGGKKLAKKGQDLKDEMDKLVDEIDEVLEQNAEEFVKNYVQRGGQ